MKPKVFLKTITAIITLATVFSMVPLFASTANATDESVTPGIVIGADNLNKGDKIYLGVRVSDGEMDPIPWVILGPPNSTQLKNGPVTKNPDNARLIITEETQDRIVFDSVGPYAHWENSGAQKWCEETFLNGSDLSGERYQQHFSDLEKGIVLQTTKADAPYEWGIAAPLNNERVFFLSLEEAFGPAYFDDPRSRISYYRLAGDDWEASEWWLRTGNSEEDITECIICVDRSGFDHNNEALGESWQWGYARPAMNIDLDAILFISKVDGGKENYDEDTGTLTEVGSTTNSSWKLTLKDDGSPNAVGNEHESFTLDSVQTCDGKTFLVDYSGAVTGENEYISAIITDSTNSIKAYGRIKKCTTESDTVVVDVGESLQGDDTLYVFNEQYNGSKRTDYASDLKEISCIPTGHIETTATTPASLTIDGSIITKCEICGETFSETIISHPKTIKLLTTSYTYDGKVKKPTVKVTDANGKTIAATNYTVTYASGRKNVGKYSVKITFKGNYSGTKTLYFKINPKGTSLKSLTAGSKSITVKWNKQATKMSTSYITGYQIQIATNSTFSKGVKNYTATKYSTVSKKLTKLTGKKKYYVRIRTYKTVSGTKYYSPWSKSKSVTTKK